MPNRFTFMKYSYIAVLFAVLCLYNVAQAQSGTNTKSLTNASNTGLYVHYDKNAYISNETIWFTAYFLDSTKTVPEILSLFVVRQADKHIVADKKFVVGNFTASGSITLPDSLLVGDYSIIAYGNYLINEQPTYLHQQPITIKVAGRNLQNATAISAGFEKGRTIQFKLYPEGGKLIANVSQLIAFEAIDSLNRPIQTRALLLENGKVIDTISSNEQGMGKFNLIANAQSVYTLKSSDNKHIGVDTLMPAFNTGVVIHLPKALVQDTLQLELRAAQATKVSIRLRNNLQNFIILNDVEINSYQILNIPLQTLPVGLTQISILDQQKEQLAERLFYAHYIVGNQKIEIQTDKSQYVKRDSVSLSLQLPAGLDTLAQVSIAVYHNNRMERNLFHDFEGQQYLSPDLRYWTEFKGAGNMGLAEDLLLIKGLPLTTQGQIGQETRIGPFTAVTFRNKKPIKKAIHVNLNGADGLEIIQTDDEGKFNVPDEKAVMEDEKSVAVFVTGNLAPITEIAVKDPYQEINKSIAEQLSWPMKISVAKQSNISATDNYIIDPNANKIEQVSISASNYSEFYAIEKLIVKNECGDYICYNNYLNCPKQWIKTSKTTLPEQGKKYLTLKNNRDTDHQDLVRYDGCTTKTNKSMQRFAGFNIPAPFFHYIKDDLDSGAPLYMSTLYWSPETILQKGKTEKLGFYVGDVPGRYTIVVQGVSNKGMVYAEAGFEVVE